jgi:hypothetical protein
MLELMNCVYAWARCTAPSLVSSRSRNGGCGSCHAGLRSRGIACRHAWTGSWTGAQDNPRATSAVSAMIRVICAGSAYDARGRTSHNPPVVGSSPTRPTSCFTMLTSRAVDRTHRATAERILARQGIRRNRPLTGREIRFRKARKTERAAQIELGNRAPDRRVFCQRMAEFQDQATGKLVLRLSRLRQRTATGGYIGSAPLTANCLRAGSSAHAVNAGDTETT